MSQNSSEKFNRDLDEELNLCNAHIEECERQALEAKKKRCELVAEKLNRELASVGIHEGVRVSNVPYKGKFAYTGVAKGITVGDPHKSIEYAAFLIVDVTFKNGSSALVQVPYKYCSQVTLATEADNGAGSTLA